MLPAAPDQVWTVWSDLASYPAWDPREEVNEPDGPLVAGTTGTFKQRGHGAGRYTVTSVDEQRGWTSETALPGGRLVIEHTVEAAPGGTRLVKRYRVHGPMVPAFRFFFARRIQAEMPGTFDALAAEIGRRVDAA